MPTSIHLQRSISWKRTSLVMLLALLALSACSFGKSKAAAEAGVEEFHRQFNAALFHEIYAASDDRLKKMATESQHVALLEALQHKLGSVQHSTESRWFVNATTGGTMVTLTYDTDFTAGKARETFVFAVSGDKAMLAGYHIDSPLLLSK